MAFFLTNSYVRNVNVEALPLQTDVIDAFKTSARSINVATSNSDHPLTQQLADIAEELSKRS
jgi:hypothetical protein